MNRKIIITALIIMPIASCNISSESDNKAALDNDLNTQNSHVPALGQYKSASCTAETTTTTSFTEETDTFVSPDSVASARLSNAIQTKDDLLVGFAYSQVALATTGSVAFLPLITVYCSYESYELNQCTYVLDDEYSHTEVTGNKADDKLSFKIESFDKEYNEITKTTVVFQDEFYRTGTMTSTDLSGKVTQTWSRDADGTEHYRTSDELGNYLEFTESSDCSGSMSMAKYGDILNQVEETKEASWSTEGQPKFDYTVCRYDDEVMGLECSSGAL